MKERGRPKIVQDEEILNAALKGFAELGYEGMSLRALSTDLGLSHSAVGQRYGTKENLFRHAVAAEFDRLFSAIGAARTGWPEQLDDLDELRALIHSFLTAAASLPALGQLMNREGVEQSDRLDYIFETVILPQIRPLIELLDRLRAEKLIHPIPTRSLFFLVAHGAEAPFTLRGFSAEFDPYDGELDVQSHIEVMTDLVMRAITL
ncbi:MAG: TetR/AcrR family transcriptional regulator [Actinomycetes bacterium]